jgi:hypothetical protein
LGISPRRISKETFMKRKINFFLIVFIFVFIFSGCEITNGGSSPSSKSTSGRITNGKTGILFSDFGYTNDNYTFKLIPKEDIEYYRDLISEEMKKYPDGYNKIIGSYKICLVRDLIYKPFKRTLGGYADGKNKVIFVSVAYGEMGFPNGNLGFIYKPAYYTTNGICHTFHHELHHLAEYSLWKTDNYYWTEYEKLYTGEHINTTNNYTIDYNAPIPKGFVTHYSTISPEEDRAEIMSYWFVYNMTLILQVRDMEDDLLDKKIVLLFTLLKNRLSFPDPLREYNEKMGR